VVVELIDDLRGEVRDSAHAFVAAHLLVLKLQRAAEVQDLEDATRWIVDYILQFDVSAWRGAYLCMMPLLCRWFTASRT
jgi:hypothetical protein